VSDSEKPVILVVGGAGYIGSHMVLALRQAGYPAVILDNLSTGHRDLAGDAELVVGDLGAPADLDALFQRFSIGAVMHFAASSLVGESVEQPFKYYGNNVAGTLALLEAMQRHGVAHFIFSSTAAVYGEPEETPIPESHPCRPTNPYGTSKYTVERMLADAAHAYGLKYTALRYFNAAGADPEGRAGERHQPETHLIPLVMQVATGERDHIKVFGTDYPTPDGTCLRDYVHVADLADAHLLALEALVAGRTGGVYNLGNSTGYSVNEVIERARTLTGHPIPVQYASRRPGDPAVLVADSTAARRDLGWRPRFESLEAIMETAWHWHRAEAERRG